MTRVRGELRETKYVMEATRSKVSHFHHGMMQTSRGIIFTRLINLKSKLIVQWYFPKLIFISYSSCRPHHSMCSVISRKGRKRRSRTN